MSDHFQQLCLQTLVVSKAIMESNNTEIKPSQIDLNKEINKIGEYEANINLHAEIQAKIHIQVVKVEEEN